MNMKPAVLKNGDFSDCEVASGVCSTGYTD